jgi:hypothetical protein
MAAELLTGLGVFKSLYDSAKALRDINDGAIRNAAVIELQEKILTAQEAQAACLERIRDLEKEVANFEAWDAEKQRYQMQTNAAGSVFFSLKDDAQPPEPTHKICGTCYKNRKKSFLQSIPMNSARRTLGFPPMLMCPECKTEIIG